MFTAHYTEEEGQIYTTLTKPLCDLVAPKVLMLSNQNLWQIGRG